MIAGELQMFAEHAMQLSAMQPKPNWKCLQFTREGLLWRSM